MQLRNSKSTLSFSRAYAFGVLAAAFAIAALWSYTRKRRGPNQSFKPTSLRDAA